jgi:hypothetical protein
MQSIIGQIVSIATWLNENNIRARDGGAGAWARCKDHPMFSSARSCTLKTSMRASDSPGTVNQMTMPECRT